MFSNTWLAENALKCLRDFFKDCLYAFWINIFSPLRKCNSSSSFVTHLWELHFNLILQHWQGHKLCKLHYVWHFPALPRLPSVEMEDGNSIPLTVTWQPSWKGLAAARGGGGVIRPSLRAPFGLALCPGIFLLAIRTKPEHQNDLRDDVRKRRNRNRKSQICQKHTNTHTRTHTDTTNLFWRKQQELSNHIMKLLFIY